MRRHNNCTAFWICMLAAAAMFLSGCATSGGSRDSVGYPTLGNEMRDRRYASLDMTGVYGALDWMWNNTINMEWQGCIQGVIRNDTLFATGVELGRMSYSSPTSVRSSCRLSPTLVATIHPHYGHPDDPCVPSLGDIKSFDADERHVYAFNLVQCSQNTVYVDQTHAAFADLPPLYKTRADVYKAFGLDPIPQNH